MKHIKKIDRNSDTSKILTKQEIENIFQELIDEGCRIQIKEEKVNLRHRFCIFLVFEDSLFTDNTYGFINDYYNLNLLEKASTTLSSVVHCLRRISNYDVLYGMGGNMITLELENNFTIPDSFFYV